MTASNRDCHWPWLPLTVTAIDQDCHWPWLPLTRTAIYHDCQWPGLPVIRTATGTGVMETQHHQCVQWQAGSRFQTHPHAVYLHSNSLWPPYAEMHYRLYDRHLSAQLRLTSHAVTIMDDWVLRTSYWFIHKADQQRIGALKAINNFPFEAIVIFLNLHVKKWLFK